MGGQTAWKDNATGINGMFFAFKWGCVLLLLEVVAWIGVLAEVKVFGVEW